MGLLLENAQFLNEKSTFFQKLAKLGNNDRFMRTWSGANNYAKFAALNADSRQKEIIRNAKRKEEEEQYKYISKEMQNKILNIVGDTLSKAKKAVIDTIDQFPKEYKDNDALTEQTKVIDKLQITPIFYKDNSISEENPAIILLYTYWFDGVEFALNNGIEDEDKAIENYIKKNEQQIRSKLDKIDSAAMRLFSAANIKTYKACIDKYYLDLGGFIYTTLNDMKKILDIEEK